MMKNTKRILAATCALALLGGCGSSKDKNSGSGGEEKLITAVIVKAMVTQNPTVKCVDVVTKSFVTAVYGDLATCKKAETPSASDGPQATGATVTDVAIAGDTASAVVTIKGGDTDGATGKMSLAKEDGAWRVSELGIDFLRSTLQKGLAAPTTDQSSPFSDPKVAACVGTRLQALDDSAFRALAYAAISDKDPAPSFIKAITECTQGAASSTGADTSTTDTSGGDSVSLLRRQFEQGITEAAKKDGATDAQIQCIVKKLRDDITDQDIVDEVGRKGGASPQLAKTTAKAILACG